MTRSEALSEPAAVVPFPTGYRAEPPLRILGRDPESRLEVVEGRTVRKAVRLPSGPRIVRCEAGDASLAVFVEGGRDEPRTESGRLAADDRAVAVEVASRLFGLGPEIDAAARAFEARLAETAVREICPPFADAVARQTGLRIPRTASAFEAAVWAIAGQQVNLTFAYTLRRRLAEGWGEPVSSRSAAGELLVHPTPEALAEVDPEDLRGRQFSRAKAEYLIGLARLVARGELPLDEPSFFDPSRCDPASGDEAARHEVEARLLAVRGIGRWTAGYIRLRGLGDVDAVPVGDAGLALAIERFAGLGRRASAKEQAAWLEPFAPYRGMAVYHLWESLLEPLS